MCSATDECKPNGDCRCSVIATDCWLDAAVVPVLPELLSIANDNVTGDVC